MRAAALGAVLGVMLGFGAVAAAGAADLPAMPGAASSHSHYYPFSGQRPRVGRDEDLSARSDAGQPAESYQRVWSASSVFPYEMIMRGRDSGNEAEPPRAPAEPGAR